MFSDEPDGNQLPYVLLNTDDSLVKTSGVDKEHLKLWSNVAFNDSVTGKGTFLNIYRDLLKAVAASDSKVIHELCEKNLASEFVDGVWWISPQVKAIEVVGEKDFVDSLEVADDVEGDLPKIELIDFKETSGAYIERSRNKDSSAKPVNYKFINRLNYQGYLQDPQYNISNPDSYYSINVTLLFRITTSLRLNLID